MKKFKGFTLIELIVVIAIIGVLAAILVPAMMGWVLKARITTYNNNASEICTKLQTMLTDLDTSSGLGELETCQIVYTGGNFSGVSSQNAIDSLKDINDSLSDISNSEWAAKIENGEVKAVVLSSNKRINVGGFPVQCPKDAKYRMNQNKSIDEFIPCATGTSGSEWDDMVAG